MKVKELIEQLQQVDPDAVVHVPCIYKDGTLLFVTPAAITTGGFTKEVFLVHREEIPK